MIKFIYGTMFSGKTTQLINSVEIYRRKGLNPIVLKPAIDDREGKFNGWGFTSSRLINKQIESFYYANLKKELPEIIKDHKCIFVDEAQFMSRDDVLFLAKFSDDNNLPLLAYGLKTDINGNLFKGAESFLAISDEVSEMKSLCQYNGCNELAVAHIRFVNGKRDTSKESVAIEKDNVTYMAVCRKHWRGD